MFLSSLFEVGTNREMDREKENYQFFTHNHLHILCWSFCLSRFIILDPWILFINLTQSLAQLENTKLHIYTHTEATPFITGSQNWRGVRRSQATPGQFITPLAYSISYCTNFRLVNLGGGWETRSVALVLGPSQKCEEKGGTHSPLMVLWS